jgi:hypothetical protein
LGDERRRIEAVRRAENADDAIRRGVGQRSEQHGVHDTEHGGRRANAERDRQQRGHREPTCSASRPERVANIRAQFLADGHPSFSLDETPLRLEALGPNGRHVTKALARADVSLCVVHARCFELRFAQRQVKRDLVVDVAVGAPETTWQAQESPNALHGQPPASAVWVRSAFAMAST